MSNSRWKHLVSILAMLLLMSFSLFATAAHETDDTHELKTFFQVTVREGPSTGLVAYGVLTLNIKPGTGNFTGTLTPAEDKDTGELFSSVLLKQVEHKFVPDGDVKEVAVRGTLHGHAINLIALDVGAEGKDVFGVGTTENAFSEQSEEQGLGHVAGPAVGPEEGDSGDWLTSIRPILLTAPPAITSANTTAFKVGTAGSFTVTATGVPAPSLSETGTLPAGITFSSGGVLSGTPTTAGTFPITINASNGFQAGATQSFTLVVLPPVPTFDSPLSPIPVIVASFSLDSTNHTLSITVTAADNPSTFSIFAAKASAALLDGQLLTVTLSLPPSSSLKLFNTTILNFTESGGVAATVIFKS